MENVFFSLDKELADVASLVFQTLGLPSFETGESANVFKGVYYSAGLLGLRVKIELNSYDFEDEYKYMLSIKKNYASTIIVNEAIEKNLAQIVVQLINQNLNTPVAWEIDNELRIYS